MSLWADKHRPGSLARLDFHREQAARLRNLVSEARGPLCPAPPRSGGLPAELCPGAPGGLQVLSVLSSPLRESPRSGHCA